MQPIKKIEDNIHYVLKNTNQYPEGLLKSEVNTNLITAINNNNLLHAIVFIIVHLKDKTEDQSSC